MKKIKTSTLDKKFDEGKEDILEHFDVNNARRLNHRCINNDPDALATDEAFWRDGKVVSLKDKKKS